MPEKPDWLLKVVKQGSRDAISEKTSAGVQLMGGIGSGRWRRHTKKELVEDCWQVDIDSCLREWIRQPTRFVTIPVQNFSGANVGCCEAEIVSTVDGGNALFFGLPFDSCRAFQFVPIVVKKEPSGRQRLFWSCPEPNCDKRSRKLYLPPGNTALACRQCHSLSYASQQQHDPRVQRLRRNPDLLIERFSEFAKQQNTAESFDVSKFVLLAKAASLVIGDELRSLSTACRALEPESSTGRGESAKALGN